MYFSLLIEGAPFVGHDANDHNLLLKGAPFYNAISTIGFAVHVESRQTRMRCGAPKTMDLSRGFQIEEPNVFVPWDTPESQFQQGFERLQLRRVTDGYFTTHCTSLSGLSCELGFHFYPRGSGRLLEFEFFRRSYPDLAASYHEFQRHLEQTFGSPTLTVPGSEGYLSHTWNVPGAEIVHFVQEHFGPEEHVRIRKAG